MNNHEFFRRIVNDNTSRNRRLRNPRPTANSLVEIGSYEHVQTQHTIRMFSKHFQIALLIICNGTIIFHPLTNWLIVAQKFRLQFPPANCFGYFTSFTVYFNSSTIVINNNKTRSRDTVKSVQFFDYRLIIALKCN